METDAYIKAIKVLLQTRYKNADVVAFYFNNNIKCLAGEYRWYAKVQTGIDGTCAVSVYLGGGETFGEALRELLIKVSNNTPETYDESVG